MTHITDPSRFALAAGGGSCALLTLPAWKHAVGLPPGALLDVDVYAPDAVPVDDLLCQHKQVGSLRMYC
jgi:hypothetical protein